MKNEIGVNPADLPTTQLFPCQASKANTQHAEQAAACYESFPDYLQLAAAARPGMS